MAWMALTILAGMIMGNAPSSAQATVAPIPGRDGHSCETRTGTVSHLIPWPCAAATARAPGRWPLPGGSDPAYADEQLAGRPLGASRRIGHHTTISCAILGSVSGPDSRVSAAFRGLAYAAVRVRLRAHHIAVLDVGVGNGSVSSGGPHGEGARCRSSTRRAARQSGWDS